MDRRRPGRRRRRAVRVGALLVPVVLLVIFWQPTKQVLVGALEQGALVAGAGLGLGGASLMAEEAGPVEAPVTAPSSGRASSTRSSLSAPPQDAPGSAVWRPTFDSANRFEVPERYREWAFVGAAVGLTYSGDGPSAEGHEGPGDFTHVYLDPGSLAAFRDSGTFREGSTFVLDIHRATTGVSIARDGWFEGERLGTHAAVKDSARFEGGWGYFHVDAEGRGRPVRTDACRSCHLEHGAIDNVFVQFYPLLRELPSAAEGLASSGASGPGMR